MRRVPVVLIAVVLLAGLVSFTGSAGADGERSAPPGAHWERREVGQPPREVVGGTPAAPGDFPYQVALAFSNAQGIPIRGLFCGGSLIAPDTVMTAAHCVIGAVWVLIDENGDVLDVDVEYLKPQEINVLAGTVDLGPAGGAERLEVRRIRLDPDFTVDIDAWFNTFLPDVAILELAGDSTATPVELAVPGQEALYPGGTPSTVTGWGSTGNPLGGAPTILQQGTLPVVADADCATAYGSDFDAARNLCAGDLATGLPSTCYGDSGGPLVVDNGGEPLQVGVVLGGDACGAPQRPSVFSRVAANTDWIGRYLDPDEVAGAPRRVATEQTGAAVRVSWRPPEFDGGTAITGFRVKVGPLPEVSVGRRARHADLGLADLQVGRPYRVTVRAVNAIGVGPARVRSFTPAPIALP